MTDNPEITLETEDLKLDIYGKKTAELFNVKKKRKRKIKQYQEEVRILTKINGKTTNNIEPLLNDCGGFYYEDMEK